MLIPARAGAASVAAKRPTAWVRALKPEAWVLAGLVVAAAALRFATLTSQSYWFDEALTAHEMQLSFGSMLHSLVTHETNPPLFYVMSWGWARVFGTGEASLRFISAMAGVAIVPITYACGRELVSKRAGLMAAALAALCPFMIWYSQEARTYMLLAALCGASLLFAARSARAPCKRNLGLWALCSSLAILTHFFAGFLILPEAVWLLHAARIRRTLVAVGCVGLVQAALIPLVVHDATHRTSSWIANFPLSIRIKQVPIEFAFGTLYRGSLVDYGFLVGGGVAVIAAVMVLGWGDARERRGAGVLAALVAFVLVVPLLLAALGHDFVDTRNLMPAWIPVAVLIGTACTVDRQRALGSALAAVLLGLLVIASVRIAQNPQYRRPNWRAVAAALGAASSTRAIVAYDGEFATGPLAIYMRGVPWLPAAQAPVPVSELDVIGSAWQIPANPLPAGVRLIASKGVDSLLVERFELRPGRRLEPAAVAARAGSLLPPAPDGAAVLIQRTSA